MPVYHLDPVPEPSVLPMLSAGAGGFSSLLLLFGMLLFAAADSGWFFGVAWSMAAAWAALAWACAVRAGTRVGLGEIDADAMPLITWGKGLAVITALFLCAAAMLLPVLLVLWGWLHPGW
jgi:hypothetical protein